MFTNTRKVSMPRKKLLIGAHMSIAGGYEQALIKGASIGCTAIQLFTKSNRQWYAKPITKENAHHFKKMQKETGILCVVAHASYLINLGSIHKATEEKSIKALIDELERCESLGISFLVLHPGSLGTLSKEEGARQISNNLDKALADAQSTTMILLENMAGQGSAFGSSFQELASIYQQAAHKKRLGFCFDTCHAFAAGYDISSEKTYEHVWKEFDAILGLKYLKVIHMNDSKKPLASHLDRHEDIGKGCIGLHGFDLLMNDHRFVSVPKILETPKGKGSKDILQDHLMNLQQLKKLVRE